MKRMSRNNAYTTGSSWPSTATIVLSSIVIGSLTIAWLISRAPSANTKQTATSIDAPKDSPAVVEASAAPDHARGGEDHLSTLYAKMHDDFGQTGFSSSDIVSVSKWFYFPSNPKEVPMPRPRNYSEFQPLPLPPNSVRLLVIPLDSSPSLSSMAVAVTQDFVKLLSLASPNTQVFNNQRSFYHITIFHTSHPKSIRPDPFESSGGVIGEQAAGRETLNASTPTDLTLVREEGALKELLADQEPPTLEIDRVLITRGGTLIIAWTDRVARVQQLREKLRGIFPGASSKQSSLIHTSLSRIVSEDGSHLPPPGSPALKEMQKVCDKWTEKLKGKTFKPSSAWWVRETTFSTIEGPRVKLDLKA